MSKQAEAAVAYEDAKHIPIVVGQARIDILGTRFTVEDELPYKGPHGMFVVVGPQGRVEVPIGFVQGSTYVDGPTKPMTPQQIIARRLPALIREHGPGLSSAAVEAFIAALEVAPTDQSYCGNLISALAAYERARIVS